MTTKQFNSHLEKLGLNPHSSAAVLGIHIKTAYNYANGKRRVPEPIAKLLRAMVRLGTTEV